MSKIDREARSQSEDETKQITIYLEFHHILFTSCYDVEEGEKYTVLTVNILQTCHPKVNQHLELPPEETKAPMKQ